MAKYRINGPDGEYDIEAPDGASEADVLAYAKQQFVSKPKASAADTSIDPSEGGLPFRPFGIDTGLTMPQGVSRALAGAGKAIMDTGTGIQQLAAPVQDLVAPRNRRLSDVVSGEDNSRVSELRRQVEEERKLAAPLMDTGAGMAGNIGANIALSLAPGGALKAAGMAAKAGGAAEAAAALSKAGGVLLAPKTIAQAAPAGAVMGLAQPSGSDGETLTNAGVGTVGTAALPGAVRLGKTIKAALEPFYEGGQNAILGRVYNRAAGDSAPAARAALESAAELVPGSRPTAGQAAGNAGIAALERTASAIEPAATTAIAERMAAQNAARVKALEGVSGEPGKKIFYEAERAATAKQMYDTAYEKGIDISRHPETGQFLSKAEVAARQGEITKLLKRPAIQDAVNEARTLAANEGVKMTDLAGSVKGLDYVQRALSDKIAKATGNEQRVLRDLRDRLLTTIDTLSPDYKAARQMFRDMSKPINQMDVGAEIADKSVNKLTGQLQPQAFARALSDETAARATGFKAATLENTMDPAHLETLGNIKTDLARAVAAANAGRGAGSDTVQKLAYSNIIDAAGVPTFLRNSAPVQITGGLAARAADALYGRANREMASRLATIGLEPAEVAAVMKKAAQGGNEKLIEHIAGGGSALGRAAALSLINAQQ